MFPAGVVTRRILLKNSSRTTGFLPMDQSLRRIWKSIPPNFRERHTELGKKAEIDSLPALPLFIFGAPSGQKRLAKKSGDAEWYRHPRSITAVGRPDSLT